MSGDVVLVMGPRLAGATSLVAALRQRIPEHEFVEDGELGAASPVAVVFVASAVAPLAESDCQLVDFAAGQTDLLIGVVSKIDTHRSWRDMLAVDRELLAARSSRYRHVRWVGAAAAPDFGDARLDELVELLRECLAGPDIERRNWLRAKEFRLQLAIGRYEADAAGTERTARINALRKVREDIERQRRLSKSERNIALRTQIQQVRVQLTYFARNLCTAVRAELQEDASRGRRSEFEPHAQRRAGDVVGEIDDAITVCLGELATELGLRAAGVPSPPASPDLPAPPVRSRRLEAQLMMILGAGFGLGVALGVTRLFAGLAPGLTIAGLVAGGLVGLMLTVWVVGIRGLLHDRAILDRWVTDVVTAVRSVVEERIASRVLAAESALTSQSAVRDELEAAASAGRIAEIDAELRDHATTAARSTSLRDRRLAPLRRALDDVSAELHSSADRPI